MSNEICLITMGSWEERFVKGLEHLVSTEKIKHVLIFYSEAFSHISNDNRMQASALLKSNGILFDEIFIDFNDQVESYFSIEKYFATPKDICSKSLSSLVIDISTMPREFLWSILTLIDDSKLAAKWVYYPPIKYDDVWLTRDPDLPRIALRRSGVTRYNKQTALIIVTGFDVSRTLKSISYFEPASVSLALQIGEQYANLKRNAESQKLSLKPELPNIDTFDVDAYSEDIGISKLEAEINKLLPNFNVLITSLGPKPSAIAVYKIATNFKEIGLFYVPAREYNQTYSHGILIEKRVQGVI